jgi:hypothetical protein
MNAARKNCFSYCGRKKRGQSHIPFRDYLQHRKYRVQILETFLLQYCVNIMIIAQTDKNTPVSIGILCSSTPTVLILALMTSSTEDVGINKIKIE